MKIFGRTQMLSEYSLVRSLEVMKELGFAGAEICVERQDWSLTDLDTLPVDEIRECSEALGFDNNSFSMHRNYVFDDDMFVKMQQAIRMTPQLGCRVFIFADVKADPAVDGAWARMIERTRTLVEVAEAHGVVLAKEFEPGFITGSTADMLRMFEEIPSDNLAANLDLGHAFIVDPDPLGAIRQLGEKIVHCHIENMPAGVHDHLLPQEGDMDLQAFLQELHAVGFAGGMALDLYKYDYESVSGAAIAYLQDLIGRL